MSVEPIDRARVAALASETLSALSKAVPPDGAGLTPTAYLEGGRPLASFNLPLLTLDQSALDHNLQVMDGWLAGTGLNLAPHGKTTMAPQLWQRQLDAGAWGITLSNTAQLKVAWQFGVQVVFIANPILDPPALRWIGEQLSTSSFRLLLWVDSVTAVHQLNDGLRRSDRPVEVCVELGSPGGRTGARTQTEALAVARAITEAEQLSLAGVAGYEGAVAHDDAPESLAAVDRYLESIRDLHVVLADHYQIARPVVSAGGSAYFDRVAAVLADLAGADVVLRSGAYLIHDDGFYDSISPLRRMGDATARFRSAMHGWSRVLSRPEPGLVLLDAGKRDLPFDEGLPVVQQLRRGQDVVPLVGPQVTAINDQHLFLRAPSDSPLAVGDVVRLGLSHPCTALDKWSVIPVIDNADSEQPQVIDLIRTFF